MAYDYTRLSKKIVRVYGTQAKFADALGLSERSVSLKLNSKVGWKQDEIISVCGLLEIPLADVPAYFFTAEVQN